MSLKSGVGISQGDDSYTVGANACHDAINNLGESDPSLLIVFSSVKYDQQKMLDGVRSVSPKALLVGSSTAGEITTNGPAKYNSVAVMAIKSSDIKFYAGVGEDIARSEERRVGKECRSRW